MNSSPPLFLLLLLFTLSAKTSNTAHNTNDDILRTLTTKREYLLYKLRNRSQEQVTTPTEPDQPQRLPRPSICPSNSNSANASDDHNDISSTNLAPSDHIVIVGESLNHRPVLVRMMPLAWFHQRYLYVRDRLLPRLHRFHQALERYQRQIDPAQQPDAWEHLQLAKIIVVRLGGLLRFHFHAYVEQWRRMDERNRVFKTFLRYLSVGQPECLTPYVRTEAAYIYKRVKWTYVDIEAMYWCLAVWRAILRHYGQLDRKQVIEKVFDCALDLKHFPPFPREREVLLMSWEDDGDSDNEDEPPLTGILKRKPRQ
jgi:hypothetical protein